MADSFLDLKKSRGASAEKLKAKLAEQSKQFQESDERFWKPEVDKTGIGEYEIRFLPPSKGSEDSWVKYIDYGFKGPGGWYIEKSLESIGQTDPVKELNNSLFNTAKGKEYWNKGLLGGAPKTGNTRPRTHFVLNIKVIKDSFNPKNNGKVFLFNCGNQIFDFIREAQHPKFASKKAIKPFDFWEGANFYLRATLGDNKQRTYKESEWASPSPLATDEKDLQNTWEAQHSLAEFIDPKNYKSYAELKAKLDRVVSGAVSTVTAEQEMDDEPVAPSPVQRSTPARQMKEETPPWAASEDSDNILAELQNMVDDK